MTPQSYKGFSFIEKIFFNADSRKSNADKRRFIDESICDHLHSICENLRLRKTFQAYHKGFTLLELMLAAAVLIIAISGLIAAFIGCYCLNETARNLTLATMGAEERLEEIRNHNFYEIYSDYDNTTFEVTGMRVEDAEGRVDVDDTNPDLLEITVTVCWRQVGGRIIGEARDVGGNLVIEDIDGNGEIESPVQIVTLMAKR